ncbi:hypothetical protein SK128_002037 [Halocaridina rubra]|uniref:Uncharacterized protein n=1 Tax=Halocaridina rubra TaxID=373956 RepID=A0AAN8XM27_HALRR
MMSSQRHKNSFESVFSQRKRVLSDSSAHSASPDCPAHLHKKLCLQDDMMENQKLANFSSVAPNGVNKAASVLGKKQGTEKKVLSIKNFKVHNHPAVDHIAESWRYLREAVVAIQESRKLRDNLTQEDLYRYVDNLITQRAPVHLYTDLKGIIHYFTFVK